MKQLGQSIKYRHTPHWFGFAAASILSLTLAGCGGGSSDDAVTPDVTPVSTVPTVAVPTGTAPVTIANLSAAQMAALTPVVTVGGVAINSPPVVTFAISDGTPANNPVIGFGSASTATIPALTYLRFSVAKLVPGVSGNPSQWVNYIVTNTAGQAQRPSTENVGQIVDNKNGTYTYTFYNDITKVKDKIAALALSNAGDLGDLTYDPNLTHRLTIQLSGGDIANPVNAIYDFIPATGKAVASTDMQREVVSVNSCNACHEKLTVHGARSETQYCVVCHTDQRKFGRDIVTSTKGVFPALTETKKVDATSGVTSYSYSPFTYVADGEVSGNFTTLVHKIHQGKELVKENYNYANLVFNNKGFSMLGGGQKMCSTCHDSTKAAQADNWNMKPSQTACGSCHDGINWATGGGSTLADKAAASKVGAVLATSGHAPGQPLSNQACAICHTPADIKVYHQTENKTEHNPTVAAGLVNFTYEIKSAAVDVGTNELTVVFKISADGTPLTSLSPSGFTGGPSFILAWAQTQDGITTPVDFNNLGNNRGETTGLSFANSTITGPDSSGYFTAVSKTGVKVFPAVGAKMRTVGLQGYWTQTTSTGSVARHTVSAMKTVTGDTPRRQVVDPAKCANCHEFFEGHGGNRVFSKDSTPDQFVCVMCHNPAKATSGRGISDATVNNYAAAGNFLTADIVKLAEWGLSTTFPVTVGSNWALGLPVTSNNMKDMIHGIHAGRDRATPFMDARDRTPSAITLLDFRRMDFPGKINNCETCHIAGTYASVPTAALASTQEFVNIQGNTTTALAKAALAQANDTDKVTSPFAAACVSCHNSAKSLTHLDSFKYTVVQGTRSAFQASVGAEPCAFCHGVGKIEDVTVAHKR